jgi:hypothetical protein
MPAHDPGQQSSEPDMRGATRVSNEAPAMTTAKASRLLASFRVLLARVAKC